MRIAETALGRAAKALPAPFFIHGETAAQDIARRVLTAALDDPDLAGRIRDWRLTPCGHSQVLNPLAVKRWGDAESYSDACSPCVRDRMRAWLLDGAR